MEQVWIQTYTGKKFYTLEPRVEDVCIEDIAHALSLQCRFSGHTKFHYSVAQHSFLLSLQVPDADRLWGLLHDATEAYLVDLPRPIKKNCELGRFYSEIEYKLMSVICERFELDPCEPQSVKEADSRMLWTERRDLMPPSDQDEFAHGVPVVEPYKERIGPWSPGFAEELFLDRFNHLCNRA